jgi:ADP-ribose pyrophosphatase YjhB (NUDIX family)
MPLPARYNTGYNVGVGGAVVHESRLLLVRRASRYGRGNWQIPGGYIEPDETLEAAVVREVAEESGVQAEVVGVLGIRSRFNPDNGNSTYVVMLMRAISGEPTPDGKETDQAGYFTLEEIMGLGQVPPINLEVARRVLASDHSILTPVKVTNPAGGTYMLFVG